MRCHTTSKQSTYLAESIDINNPARRGHVKLEIVFQRSKLSCSVTFNVDLDQGCLVEDAFKLAAEMLKSLYYDNNYFVVKG